ncbi:MAG: tellurite resistance TerB family protein [bacterium]
MDTRTFLDRLLETGKDLGDKGKNYAEEKLNIPEQGPERDAMLAGMSKGAMAAGFIGLLLGTKGGRAITGSAIKLGSVAAIGGLAYKTYRDWQADKPGFTKDQVEVINPAEDTSDEHSRLILRAMIGAAKSDGHIDANERISLQNFIDQLGESQELSQFVEQELSKPLDPGDIAQGVPNQEVASELYLASLLIIDQSNFMAKTYLDQLARALALPPDLVANLNTNMKQAVPSA